MNGRTLLPLGRRVNTSQEKGGGCLRDHDPRLIGTLLDSIESGTERERRRRSCVQIPFLNPIAEQDQCALSVELVRHPHEPIGIACSLVQRFRPATVDGYSVGLVLVSSCG